MYSLSFIGMNLLIQQEPIVLKTCKLDQREHLNENLRFRSSGRQQYAASTNERQLSSSGGSSVASLRCPPEKSRPPGTAMTYANLEAELKASYPAGMREIHYLAAESQLAVCKRQIVERDRPRPRFTRAFRLLWVLLSRVWDEWHQVAHLMQPATVKRWHTTAFRLYWRRKSKGQVGRPAIPREMRDLIRRLSRENPLWSAERIGDTLRLLGCDPPCDDTIRKYMGQPNNQPDKPTNWLPFLRNHLDISWAIDFFTGWNGVFRGDKSKAPVRRASARFLWSAAN